MSLVLYIDNNAWKWSWVNSMATRTPFIQGEC